MNSSISQQSTNPATTEHWLQRYYLTRAGFSIAWIITILVTAQRWPGLAPVLLVCYPLWDALCNLADGRRSGGLGANRTQLTNAVVSVAVAVALAVALPDLSKVFAVFGAWAILSGVLQLWTALRRRKVAGAQWAMILSGAQSSLAGAFFIKQAGMAVVPPITSLVGYAGFGAFYFLASAISLHLIARRRTLRSA